MVRSQKHIMVGLGRCGDETIRDVAVDGRLWMMMRRIVVGDGESERWRRVRSRVVSG